MMAPFSSYVITENHCEIAYTMDGQTCTAFKLELTAMGNGVYPGEILVTFGDGSHATYDQLIGHIP